LGLGQIIRTTHLYHEFIEFASRALPHPTKLRKPLTRSLYGTLRESSLLSFTQVWKGKLNIHLGDMPFT
jgi:hypothetical protein